MQQPLKTFSTKHLLPHVTGQILLYMHVIVELRLLTNIQSLPPYDVQVILTTDPIRVVPP